MWIETLESRHLLSAVPAAVTPRSHSGRWNNNSGGGGDTTIRDAFRQALSDYADWRQKVQQQREEERQMVEKLQWDRVKQEMNELAKQLEIRQLEYQIREQEFRRQMDQMTQFVNSQNHSANNVMQEVNADSVLAGKEIAAAKAAHQQLLKRPTNAAAQAKLSSALSDLTTLSNNLTGANGPASVMNSSVPGFLADLATTNGDSNFLTFAVDAQVSLDNFVSGVNAAATPIQNDVASLNTLLA